MKRLFVNAIIVPMTYEEKIYYDACLGIDGDRIIYLGVKDDVDESDYDEIVDCKDKVILPGFINTHCHAAMSILRGYADDLPLKEWLEEKIWPLEAKFCREQIRAGTALAILEMIKSGVTCFADMYYFMDEVLEIVLETKIRAVLSRGVVGTDNETETLQKIEEAISFAKKCKEKFDDKITAMLSPHSPYTCSTAVLQQFIKEAQKLALPLHIHLAETKKEVYLNLQKYGKTPVYYLEDLGFFNLPTLIAHAVHLTEDEIDVLVKYDVKVSHNPGSNLKLGSGIAPIVSMLNKGLKPSLATDGAASNNNLDMLEEIRLAALIHKGFYRDPKVVPAYTALKMGTIYGAEALFIAKNVGSLEINKKADFITLSLKETHMVPLHNIVSHLVYSANSNDIQDVFVAGIPLMRNREVLVLDEEKVHFEAINAFEKLKV